MNRERLHEALEQAARVFEQQLEPRHIEALETGYGLTPETIREARIGWAPTDPRALPRALRSAGFDEVERLQTGLFWRNGAAAWRGRIVFPYLVDGEPRYFIARETPETEDGLAGKYAKQARRKQYVHDAVREPVYGRDSVKEDAPLVVTEGVTDCLAAQQAGYASIAPVTTQFKGEALETVLELCSAADPLVVVMDAEESEAGLQGAVKTGLQLSREGLFPLLGELPRPDGEDVDLADFLRDGADLDTVLEGAEFVEMHPVADEIKAEERRATVEEWNRERRRELKKERGIETGGGDLPDPDEVRDALPRLSSLVGFNGLGEHPVHGSTTGGNLSVEDGEGWFCHRKGCKSGGGPLKWVAVDEGLIPCDGELRGKVFVDALKKAAEISGRGFE